MKVKVLVTQLCPTLCNPTDCSLPGSFVHGDSSGKNTGVGCQDLLQGIFLTKGSNPGLPHCRQILYLWATREATPNKEHHIFFFPIIKMSLTPTFLLSKFIWSFLISRKWRKLQLYSDECYCYCFQMRKPGTLLLKEKQPIPGRAG